MEWKGINGISWILLEESSLKINFQVREKLCNPCNSGLHHENVHAISNKIKWLSFFSYLLILVLLLSYTYSISYLFFFSVSCCLFHIVISFLFHALLVSNVPTLLFFTVLHTSASLAINENWDPDVRLVLLSCMFLFSWRECLVILTGWSKNPAPPAPGITPVTVWKFQIETWNFVSFQAKKESIFGTL